MTELEHADRNRFALVATGPRTFEVVALELVPLSIVSYYAGRVVRSGTRQECIDYIADQLGKRARAERRLELVST